MDTPKLSDKPAARVCADPGCGCKIPNCPLCARNCHEPEPAAPGAPTLDEIEAELIRLRARGWTQRDFARALHAELYSHGEPDACPISSACDAIEPCPDCPRARPHTVSIKYFECAFCGDTFDRDDPRVLTSPNDCRDRCPHDGHELTQLSAGVEVGEEEFMTFKEQIEEVWALAQQCLKETGSHYPQLVATSPEGQVMIVTLVLPPDVLPRDVIPNILRDHPAKQFIFISEAWGLTQSTELLQGAVRPGETIEQAAERLRAALPASLADCSDREEILLLIAVSRDYQEARQIAFEHTDDGGIAYPHAPLIMKNNQDGGRIVGAFIDMRETLELLN